MAVDRDIPQRELRNDVASVLRDVEAGARLRVTVRGRPVAELVPTSSRASALSGEQLRALLREAPLDAGFEADLDLALGATINEL